jgi:hypothetical protein
MVHYNKDISYLKKFKKSEDQIRVLKRKEPIEAQKFFQKLYQFPFSIFGNVHKNNTKTDIKKLLNYKIPGKLQRDPFYENWLDDMSQTCKLFCSFQEEDNISYWLGSKRGCKRYHVDMVPYRLLVTYAGQGTELLPNKAADRKAFIEGKCNEKIIKDKSALRFIGKWNIALFRGGKKGILHRTPDSASNNNSSILMRLDSSSFLEKINDINHIM